MNQRVIYIYIYVLFNQSVHKTIQQQKEMQKKYLKINLHRQRDLIEEKNHNIEEDKIVLLHYCHFK